MWKQGKKPGNAFPWRMAMVVLFLIHASRCSSSVAEPPSISATPTTMDDGVQRIGVGEVLIVDEFGREARSYWDESAAEEKVEAVTVYGGMEVGGSSSDGGPDVVKGQHMKEKSQDTEEDKSADTLPLEDNYVKEKVSETTLLDCVLQGDITCIQKKAFRALQKLIQMSNPTILPSVHSSSIGDDQVSSKESEAGTEKVNKGIIPGGHAWWSVNTGVFPAPQEGATGASSGVVGEVMNAVSSNGGMSRLLEEVRELVVDLVSNVISLQGDEEDKKRNIERRSNSGKKIRKRRGVVPKKGAGPAPSNIGNKVSSGFTTGVPGVSEVGDLGGTRENPTGIMRTKQKKKRTGMSSILVGIMVIKSFLSYMGMLFSQALQLKQLGISVLTFLVQVVRLVLQLRQSNPPKPPQTDTKVVYLKPQYNHPGYGEHSPSQYYHSGEHYKRSFDGSSSPETSGETPHEMAYRAQMPSEIK